MKKRTYAVIGLGKFGQYVAKGLIRNGESVIVCDDDSAHLREFKDISDEVYALDATDKEALREAGVKELDVVIISIGEDIESSILSVIALQELKNKYIIAKAVNRSHSIILNRLGVDLVIRPERDASSHLLDKLLWGRNFIFAPDENLEISQLVMEQESAGLSVRQQQERLAENLKAQRIGDFEEVRVVGLRRGQKWHLSTGLDSEGRSVEGLQEMIIESGDVLLLLYARRERG